jgi:uncharacterized protein
MQDDRNVLMNPDERAILENFLHQLVQVRGVRKIREAEAMIRRAVERQPDAAYLLAQRSLMLEQALEKTKARLAKYELTQEQGSALGADTSSARVSPNSSPEPLRGGGEPSFLGLASPAAAGIVGEAFLVQGLEHLIDDDVGDDDYARLS